MITCEMCGEKPATIYLKKGSRGEKMVMPLTPMIPQELLTGGQALCDKCAGRKALNAAVVIQGVLLLLGFGRVGLDFFFAHDLISPFLRVAYAGIDHAVQKVGYEVACQCQNGEEAPVEDGEGYITGYQSVIGDVADTGDCEEGLGDQCAGEKTGQRTADDGDQRNEGVAESVTVSVCTFTPFLSVMTQ